MEETQAELPCPDKQVHDSKQQADAVALATDWQHGDKLRSYRCRHCSLWHLTTQPED